MIVRTERYLLAFARDSAAASSFSLVKKYMLCGSYVSSLYTLLLLRLIDLARGSI